MFERNRRLPNEDCGNRLPAVQEFLSEIANDADSARAIEAWGMVAQLDFHFVLLLNVSRYILIVRLYNQSFLTANQSLLTG